MEAERCEVRWKKKKKEEEEKQPHQFKGVYDCMLREEAH